MQQHRIHLDPKEENVFEQPWQKLLNSRLGENFWASLAKTWHLTKWRDGCIWLMLLMMLVDDIKCKGPHKRPGLGASLSPLICSDNRLANHTNGIFQGSNPTKGRRQLLLKYPHCKLCQTFRTEGIKVILGEKKRVTFRPIGSLFHPFTLCLSLRKVDTLH